jgi:hypothetical protein
VLLTLVLVVFELVVLGLLVLVLLMLVLVLELAIDFMPSAFSTSLKKLMSLPKVTPCCT